MTYLNFVWRFEELDELEDILLLPDDCGCRDGKTVQCDWLELDATTPQDGCKLGAAARAAAC